MPLYKRHYKGAGALNVSITSTSKPTVFKKLLLHFAELGEADDLIIASQYPSNPECDTEIYRGSMIDLRDVVIEDEVHIFSGDALTFRWANSQGTEWGLTLITEV